ncbi:hypothetical protein [Siphonobacter sp. SORGH_AS_1065]|uniref:hypothetical protein n=1 Tax=Siphonobacter sp. SORGH_AS_1065 TaxID=3041795 RepID=UPI002781C644|nr:hypothetical protein [Siphonobacter sp. SORGH_AS_1065]MDQ1089017.1 hypothetical protein [Siphonobacter sp. SORGH_AS_1065]
MGEKQEPEKVQSVDSWDSGLHIRPYSRWKDKKGRIFIVMGQTTEWDEKRQKSKGWATITLFNYHQLKPEDPMPFDRFVHYVAIGKLTRYLPKPIPKDPF